jgi:hypothetical protein
MGDAEANSSREIRVPVTTIFSVVTFSSSSCAYAAGIAFTATPTNLQQLQLQVPCALPCLVYYF